jgi:hypothetical protein
VKPLVVHADDVSPQAWRNGGGRTRELYTWPAGGVDGGWQLRISQADIDTDGPFSAFAGITRWFAVVDGAGVLLALPAGEHRLTPHDAPLCFDGAAAPGCRLLDGPTRDLNLMHRGGVAVMSAVEPGQPWAGGGGGGSTAQAGLYSAAPGNLHVAGDVINVPARTLVWFTAQPDGAMRFELTLATAPAGWWLALDPEGSAR